MDKLPGPLRFAMLGVAVSFLALSLSACWFDGAPPPPMGVDPFEVPTASGSDVVLIAGDWGEIVDTDLGGAGLPPPSPPSAPSSSPPSLPFGGLIPWTPSQTMTFDDTKLDNEVPPGGVVPGNPGPPPATIPFIPLNGWGGGPPPPSMTLDPNGTSITYNPQPGVRLIFTPPPQLPDPILELPQPYIPELPQLYPGIEQPYTLDDAWADLMDYMADTLFNALQNYTLQTSGYFPPTSGGRPDKGGDETIPGVVGDLRNGDDVLPYLGHLGGGQPIPQGTTSGWPTGLGYDTPHGPPPMPVNTNPGPAITPTPVTPSPTARTREQLPQEATAPTTGPATTPSTTPSNAPTSSSGPPTPQTSTTSNPGLPTATPSPNTHTRQQLLQEATSPTSGPTTTPSSPNNASSLNRREQLLEDSKSVTTGPVTTPTGEGGTPRNVRRQELLEEVKPGSASSTPSHGVSSEREHSIITHEAPQDMHSVTRERGSSRPEEFAPGSRTTPRTDPGRETAFGSRSTSPSLGGSGVGQSPSSSGFASPGGSAFGGHSFGGGGSGGAPASSPMRREPFK